MTTKQERFAQLIASEDISQVAAYVDAGYSSAQLDKQLRTKASALAGNGDIVGRVAELREAAAKAAGVTRDGHLAKLAEIRDLALAGDKTAQGNVVKNYGAAVQAEGLRGKHSGVAAPDKHQDVTPDIPAEAMRLKDQNVQLLEALVELNDSVPKYPHEVADIAVTHPKETQRLLDAVAGADAAIKAATEG